MAKKYLSFVFLIISLVFIFGFPPSHGLIIAGFLISVTLFVFFITLLFWSANTALPLALLVFFLMMLKLVRALDIVNSLVLLAFIVLLGFLFHNPNRKV